MSYETIRKRYEAAGQGHLLQFWPKLSDSERAALLAQLDAPMAALHRRQLGHLGAAQLRTLIELTALVRQAP